MLLWEVTCLFLVYLLADVEARLCCPNTNKQQVLACLYTSINRAVSYISIDDVLIRSRFPVCRLFPQREEKKNKTNMWTGNCFLLHSTVVDVHHCLSIPCRREGRVVKLLTAGRKWKIKCRWWWTDFRGITKKVLFSLCEVDKYVRGGEGQSKYQISYITVFPLHLVILESKQTFPVIMKNIVHVWWWLSDYPVCRRWKHKSVAFFWNHIRSLSLNRNITSYGNRMNDSWEVGGF